MTARNDAANLAMPLKQVRSVLGLSVDEVQLAVETGLLKARGRRNYDAGSVLAAAADRKAWRARLGAEQRLNATEAAARLGVTTERFRRAVAANGVQPVKIEPWRYGLISYYRAADVDALAPWLVMDAAARHVAAVAKRPEAARKAAETRRRNTEEKRVAREQLAALMPSATTPSPELVRFVTALLVVYEQGAGKLGRYRHDYHVGRLAGIMAKARLSDQERSKLLCDWHGPALEAASWLTEASKLERGYGLHPGSLCNRLPCISGMVSQTDFDALLRDDPGYIEECRQKEQARLILEEARRLAEAEERRAAMERVAVQVRAEIIANDPGPNSHPVDAANWALTGLSMLGFADHPLVSRMRNLAGQDFARHLRSRLDSHARLQHKDFRDDELVKRMLGVLDDAAKLLSPIWRIFGRNRCSTRLVELRRRGLRSLGELAVRPEIEAIVDADAALAERWAEEDAVDQRRAELKAQVKRDKRAAKQARRRERMQTWRKQWAQALGIPVEQVPAKVVRPTADAIESALGDRQSCAGQTKVI
jgi:hypothetical protein